MQAVKMRIISLLVLVLGLTSSKALGQTFEIRIDENKELLQVFKKGVSVPLVIQNATRGMRPYLHPVRTPDGKGVLSEIHPSHHLHQTGIYWGLKNVNGRDYFMNSGEDYYQYQSLRVLKKTSNSVSWETVYDLLDENGVAILRESQIWSLKEQEEMLLLDLEWQGLGLKDVKIKTFFVGGLFMRMPWTDDIAGEAINSVGSRNREEADGQRADWVDVGMEIAGLEEWGHIAILDHPHNEVSPTPWRVDKQLGVGPSRQILGDWQLKEGQTTSEAYRLLVYTGDLDKEKLTRLRRDYGQPNRN